MADPLTIGGLVLGGINALTGAKKSGEASAIEDRALKIAEAQEADRARLRQTLMGRLPELTRDFRPDLSGMFASANPFARTAGRAPALTPLTLSPPTTPQLDPESQRLQDLRDRKAAGESIGVADVIGIPRQPQTPPGVGLADVIGIPRQARPIPAETARGIRSLIERLRAQQRGG